MVRNRFLIVTADDYGIGSETSKAVLELALKGVVTAAVFIVNSPYSYEAVVSWRKKCGDLEIGWHPCLTLDIPILPADQVPSLVDGNGRFFSLGKFIRRWVLGDMRSSEIKAELKAQYEQFCQWTGHPPNYLCTHHHIQIFRQVGNILVELLKNQKPLPYFRRVREPIQTLMEVPGERLKRALLSTLGRVDAMHLNQEGFPGNDWLVGINGPSLIEDLDLFSRWLSHIPGEVIEMTCHPGFLDSSLIDRDCTSKDGWLQRRVKEYQLLSNPGFLESCHAAGFNLISPSQLIDRKKQR